MNDVRHRSIILQVNIQSLWSKVPGHRLAGLDDAMRLWQVFLAKHLFVATSAHCFNSSWADFPARMRGKWRDRIQLR